MFEIAPWRSGGLCADFWRKGKEEKRKPRWREQHKALRYSTTLKSAVSAVLNLAQSSFYHQSSKRGWNNKLISASLFLAPGLCLCCVFSVFFSLIHVSLQSLPIHVVSIFYKLESMICLSKIKGSVDRSWCKRHFCSLLPYFLPFLTLNKNMKTYPNHFCCFHIVQLCRIAMLLINNGTTPDARKARKLWRTTLA